MHEAVICHDRNPSPWFRDQIPANLWSVRRVDVNAMPDDYHSIVEYRYAVHNPNTRSTTGADLGYEWFTGDDPEPQFAIGDTIVLNKVKVTVTDVDVDSEVSAMDGRPVAFFSVTVHA